VGAWQQLLWAEGDVELRRPVSVRASLRGFRRAATVAATRPSVSAEALAIWDYRRWAVADRVAFVRV